VAATRWAKRHGDVMITAWWTGAGWGPGMLMEPADEELVKS